MTNLFYLKKNCVNITFIFLRVSLIIVGRYSILKKKNMIVHTHSIHDSKFIWQSYGKILHCMIIVYEMYDTCFNCFYGDLVSG